MLMAGRSRLHTCVYCVHLSVYVCVCVLVKQQTQEGNWTSFTSYLFRFTFGSHRLPGNSFALLLVRQE